MNQVVCLLTVAALVAAAGCNSAQKNPNATTFTFRVTGIKGRPGVITDE